VETLERNATTTLGLWLIAGGGGNADNTDKLLRLMGAMTFYKWGGGLYFIYVYIYNTY